MNHQYLDNEQELSKARLDNELRADQACAVYPSSAQVLQACKATSSLCRCSTIGSRNGGLRVHSKPL